MYLKRIDVIIRVIFGSFFLSLSLLAVAAPTIQSIFGYPSGEGLYSLLSPICHQYPTRSLWILNRPFALCSRCFSGYLGVGIGLYFIQSQKKYLFRLLIGFLLILPGILDGLIQLNTSYESVNMIRVLTGFLGGLGVFYLFYPIRNHTTTTKGLKK